MDCDQELASLSGYHVPSELVGVNITKLIPALQLPSGTNINKVCVCDLKSSPKPGCCHVG